MIATATESGQPSDCCGPPTTGRTLRQRRTPLFMAAQTAEPRKEYTIVSILKVYHRWSFPATTLNAAHMAGSPLLRF